MKVIVDPPLISKFLVHWMKMMMSSNISFMKGVDPSVIYYKAI